MHWNNFFSHFDIHIFVIICTMIAEIKTFVGQNNMTVFHFSELKKVICKNICHDSKTKWNKHYSEYTEHWLCGDRYNGRHFNIPKLIILRWIENSKQINWIKPRVPLYNLNEFINWFPTCCILQLQQTWDDILNT